MSGLVHVYTGNGKGKTTAALGLALRAAGHGFRVKIIQFLKGSCYSGELYSIPRLFPVIEIDQYGYGCPSGALIKSGVRQCQGCGDCFKRNRDPQDNPAPLGWAAAAQAINSGNYQMVIMDELNHALQLKLLVMEEVLAVIRQRPSEVEIVITGRNAPPEVLNLADYVTEMRAVKHPNDQGINSRRGIEY